MPSSSLRNLSLDVAYSILARIRDTEGDLNEKGRLLVSTGNVYDINYVHGIIERVQDINDNSALTRIQRQECQNILKKKTEQGKDNCQKNCRKHMLLQKACIWHQMHMQRDKTAQKAVIEK